MARASCNSWYRSREEKLQRIHADILPENRGMIRVCEKLGFHLRHDDAAGLVKAEIEL